MPRVYTDDPEKDPDYEDALARFVAAQGPSTSPDADLSNDEKIRRVNGALSLSRQSAGGAPAPMTALASMATGATQAPTRADGMTDSELDRAVQDKLGPKSGWNAPPPTPEGTALLSELENAAASARPPEAPEVMLARKAGGALASGVGGLARMATRGFLQTTDQPARGAWYDSPPEPAAPPPSAPALAPPVPRPALSGRLPPVSPPAPVARSDGPARPLTDLQGANIMAALKGPVSDIVRDASGVPPAPSGVTPPGTQTGPPSPVPPEALTRAREVLGPAKERPDPLTLALAASRGDRLIAGLSRAGGAAIGRGTGPGYDALDENADRPLQELGLREQADARAKAEAVATGSLSPTEQSVYGKLLAQAGVSMDPAMLAKLPAGKVRALIPDLEKMGAMETTRADKAAALKQAASQAEENRQNHLDVARIAHSGTAGLREDRLQEQKDKRLEADRQKASKDAEEYSQTSDARATLEQALQSKPGEIAGVGRAVGRLANVGIGSDAGIKNRQAMSTLGNLILKARSGSAVTPSEMERSQIETGMAPGATEQQMRIGAEATLKVMKRAEANTHAKYREGVWEEIGGSGGYVPTRGGAPAARPAGGGPSPDDLERLWGGL